VRTTRRTLAALVALVLTGLVGGCGQPVGASVPLSRVTAAPQRAYPVGVRTFMFDRGSSRPLPTTVWYPARAAADGRTHRDAPLADGRFPLVLFSHGLNSLPEMHAQLTTRWAAAGFVVAAPAYPHTSRLATRFSRADVARQPADAWQVVEQVSRLDGVPADPFAGHLDLSRVAAVGHSAGGYTTAGLFTSGHSERLRAGVVIAGGGMEGAFAGPPAALLFVHGGADPTVPLTRGRAAYEQVSWPKAFLTLAGQGHGAYLVPGRPGFDQTVATVTDFLRWRLYGDDDARARLPVDARSPGVSTFESRL
jgi:dienelactone hydrolase